MAEYVPTAPVFVAGLDGAGNPVVGSAICRRGGGWELLVVCWPHGIDSAAVVGMAPSQGEAIDLATQAASDPWPWNDD